MISIIWAGALVGMTADDVTNSGTSADAITEVAPLASVDIDWSAKSATGKQTYEIRMQTTDGASAGDQLVQGQVTLETTLDAETVMLQDQWILAGRSFDFKMTCAQDSYLSVQNGEIGIVHDEARRVIAFSVEDEVANYTSESLDLRSPCPEGTIAQIALFRIVPQLPREAGRVFGFSGFNLATDLRVTVPGPGQQFTISYAGSDSIAVNGTETPCERFTVQADHAIDYFVDAQSRVIRVVDGTMIMDLVTTEIAETADHVDAIEETEAVEEATVSMTEESDGQPDM